MWCMEGTIGLYADEAYLFPVQLLPVLSSNVYLVNTQVTVVKQSLKTDDDIMRNDPRIVHNISKGHSNGKRCLLCRFGS